jgi:hypothetical protein
VVSACTKATQTQDEVVNSIDIGMQLDHLDVMDRRVFHSVPSGTYLQFSKGEFILSAEKLRVLLSLSSPNPKKHNVPPGTFSKIFHPSPRANRPEIP